jgi:magnesium transporter
MTATSASCRVRTLLVSDPGSSVRELMITSRKAIPVGHARRRGGAPVRAQRLGIRPGRRRPSGYVVGRITIDDVVDVIREDADHSLMSMAGLDEDDDTFAPALKTARRRAIWLGVNLLTAFIASRP